MKGKKEKLVLWGNVIVFALLGVLVLVILSIPVLINMGILSLLKNVVTLGIKVQSTTGLILFGVGVLFYFIPSMTVGFVLELVIQFLFAEREKVKDGLGAAAGFFLVLFHMYVLDVIIEDITFSLYGLLALAFVYSLIFDAMEHMDGLWNKKE
ncbi:hypothetical protein [Laceyella sacchari]|uniref:Regulatory protein YrvL n=1 Tax=Laceyella sacchari TaxID=37482 RepID=A0ABY5U470_LACSH|nr:hypothetical protein [Laceyella sacchari]UWE03375.1 hypothetical protein NYR52_14870 [Laceyella sacchari]